GLIIHIRNTVSVSSCSSTAAKGSVKNGREIGPLVNVPVPVQVQDRFVVIVSAFRKIFSVFEPVVVVIFFSITFIQIHGFRKILIMPLRCTGDEEVEIVIAHFFADGEKIILSLSLGSGSIFSIGLPVIEQEGESPSVVADSGIIGDRSFKIAVVSHQETSESAAISIGGRGRHVYGSAHGGNGQFGRAESALNLNGIDNIR